MPTILADLPPIFADLTAHFFPQNADNCHRYPIFLRCSRDINKLFEIIEKTGGNFAKAGQSNGQILSF